jgi:hypothetical protein
VSGQVRRRKGAGSFGGPSHIVGYAVDRIGRKRDCELQQAIVAKLIRTVQRRPSRRAFQAATVAMGARFNSTPRSTRSSTMLWTTRVMRCSASSVSSCGSRLAKMAYPFD